MAIRPTSRIAASKEVGVCPENCGCHVVKQRSFVGRRKGM